MFCSNCGNELKEEALFCTKCGAKVKKDSVETESEKSVDEKPVESQKLVEHEKEEKTPVEEKPTDEKTDKPSLWKRIPKVAKIVTAIVLVVAILGVVGFNVWNSFLGWRAPANRIVSMVNKRSTNYQKMATVLGANYVPTELRPAVKDIFNICEKYSLTAAFLDEVLDGDTFEYALQELYDDLYSEYGSDWTLKLLYGTPRAIPDYDVTRYNQYLQRTVYLAGNTLANVSDVAELIELVTDRPEYETQQIAAEIGNAASDIQKAAEKMKVSKVYTLDVTVVVSGSEDSDTTHWLVDVLKVGSKWIPIPYEEDYDLVEDDADELRNDLFDDWDDVLEDMQEELY